MSKNQQKGLYQKYTIRKVTGTKKHGFHGIKFTTKPVDPEAEYFVLRLDLKGDDRKHALACRTAIQAYANEIEARFPELAADIRKKWPSLPPVSDGPLLKL